MLRLPTKEIYARVSTTNSGQDKLSEDTLGIILKAGLRSQTTWLKHLNSPASDNGTDTTHAVFHSHRPTIQPPPKSIVCLFPIKEEPPNTLTMQRHCMDTALTSLAVLHPPLLPPEDGTEEEEPLFWWSDGVQPGTVFMQCELMQWF